MIIHAEKITDKRNVFKRTDGRWCGCIWFMNEQGERKRKSFSGTTKQEVNKKIKDYIAAFEDANSASHESKKRLRESMQNWLELFKFPAVERSTYDRLECTAKHQIYPVLGDKVVGDITSADIRDLLNQEMVDGYAYTTVKKVHVLLNEYFRYLTQQELIVKNPMTSTPMIKKSNFMAAQDKEDLPEYDTVTVFTPEEIERTVFTPEEIERFKAEAFRCYSNGNRVYQQAAAYILMLNTGLRTGELLGLLNSDIDLEHRVMHLNRGVKEVAKRDGVTAEHGREVKTGKLKSASSKRDVPLNDTAVSMIQDLRAERYMGEDTPLVCDENGDYTRPVNFRKRYYRVLQAAGIPTKGLHALRHTFATNLVNGIRQPDGTIKALTPRQVADLLGHTTSQITLQRCTTSRRTPPDSAELRMTSTSE